MAEITGQTNDGYHTFDELYRHRSVLFVALMKAFAASSWYSSKHDDGTMFDGMFICGMNLPGGQITYHLNVEPWWELLRNTPVPCLAFAPRYDGHTSDDVINRLTEWVGPTRG